MLGDRTLAKTSIQIVKLSQQPKAKISLKFLANFKTAIVLAIAGKKKYPNCLKWYMIINRMRSHGPGVRHFIGNEEIAGSNPAESLV